MLMGDVAQKLASAVDTGANGSDRGPLNVSNFGIAQAFEIAEFDGLSIHVGQFAKGTLKLRLELGV